MDKDIELSKVQILASDFQSKINSVTALIFGGLIVIIAFLMRIPFDSITNIVTVALSYLLLYILFVFGAFGIVKKRQNENLEYLDGLLKKISDGEALQSLTELKKKK